MLIPSSAPTDEIGHGTMVAGIAAAKTNNSTGVAGAAWNSRIMPIKVLTGDVAYDSDIATGIYWAVDHGAKIINLSLASRVPPARAAVDTSAGPLYLTVSLASR